MKHNGWTVDFDWHPDDTTQDMAWALLNQEPFHTGEWQSLDTSKSKVHATYELEDVRITYDIPAGVDTMREQIKPNLPWADEHFAERVGGKPLNPPPSHVNWPWARHNATHQTDKKFSHTYPERMWPRWAHHPDHVQQTMHGIRFAYGDLSDVVDLLVKSPMTRQAYLPIWFPEDTGAHHGQRVPCTLGYHFMMRNDKLSCRYYIRSCDILRHMRDDIYLASRLTEWICRQVNYKLEDLGVVTPGIDPMIEPGRLVMHISSLHAFVGDRSKLTDIAGVSK